MVDVTRRGILKGSAGIAAASAIGGTAGAQAQTVAPPKLAIEKGASIRVLRPAKFVQGDETVWLENSKKFEQTTGVKVRVDSESWEDLRPKTSVAANVGKGPDVIYSWYDDAFQFPEKLVDVTDIAEYLGKKYGGWYPVCERFGKRNGRWISVPLGASGSTIVYRKSWVNEAGFDGIPKDLGGFLKLCQALNAKGHPPGFALGQAVGDANGWCHWVVWAHGGRMVDEHDNVVINSPETIAALEYAKELYKTFIPGTLSWQDPSNNKAFLDGQIGLTANGISIYYVAKTSTDQRLKDIALDIQHGAYPVGVTGKPTEVNLIVPALVMKYSKFPNAAKEYVRFMMEQEQFEPWSNASIGYFSHPLKAYEKLPVWSVDPKHTPYRDTLSKMLWPSYAGSLGISSAGVLADYVMVNMVAQAASGDKTPKEAAELAQKRAERYYKI